LKALTAARRLVQDSGTRGARVDVWIFRTVAAYGPYMVSVLDSLGYKARLKVVDDENKYFNAVFNPRTGAQIGYVTWGYDAASAPDFLRQDYSCAASKTSLTGFCDHSIDAQMAHASAVQVQDPPAGAVLWQQVERSVLAQAPAVPTYVPSDVTFVSKRVGNYQHNPQAGVLLDQLWIK
jgi:peptide/nickel transport system substrate-binding protein